MATNKQQAPTTTKQIDNTQSLREALVHAAIGLHYDYADTPANQNEADDRAAGRILAELAKQLGATL